MSTDLRKGRAMDGKEGESGESLLAAIGFLVEAFVVLHV